MTSQNQKNILVNTNVQNVFNNTLDRPLSASDPH